MSRSVTSPVQNARRSLVLLGACTPATDWVATVFEDATPDDLWRICDDPSRLAWLLGRLSLEPGTASRRKLVGCFVRIFELATGRADRYASELGALKGYVSGGPLDESKRPTADQVRSYDVPATCDGYAIRSLFRLAVARFGDDEGFVNEPAFETVDFVGELTDMEGRRLPSTWFCDEIRKDYPTAPEIPASFMVRGGVGSSLGRLEDLP